MTVPFGDAGAPQDATIKALPQGLFSSFGYMAHDTMAALPNTLLTVTLASNFGTFLLYMLSCFICIVAYHNHPNFSFLRHLLIPVFGLVANLGCMAFYLIGPFMGFGTAKEPLLALGIAVVWALYGGIYFMRSSKAKGRTTLVGERGMGATSVALSRRSFEIVRAGAQCPPVFFDRDAPCSTSSLRNFPISENLAITTRIIWGMPLPETPEQARTHGWLFALADGVGGHDDGEVASRAAVEHLTSGFREAPKNEPLGALLTRLVQAANLCVYETGKRASVGGTTMATTIVACALRYDRAAIAHAGDSRCYLIRRGLRRRC